jgi:hypothetical protein
MGTGMLQEMVGWMGGGMGEELHQEMCMGMHDNLLPQIQIVQEILQQNNKNEKHKNPCLHILKELCKIEKISHDHDKLQHCFELFAT